MKDTPYTHTQVSNTGAMTTKFLNDRKKHRGQWFETAMVVTSFVLEFSSGLSESLDQKLTKTRSGNTVHITFLSLNI